MYFDWQSMSKIHLANGLYMVEMCIARIHEFAYGMLCTLL